MYLMAPYDSALEEILHCGVPRTNKRTGIKTRSVFGMLRRYALNNLSHPILTRRKAWPKSVFGELLWFLSGSTNNKDLVEKHNCKFWTPWVDDEFEKKYGYVEGSFGPVYGFQLRSYGGSYGNGGGGREFTDEDVEKITLDDGTVVEHNLYGLGGFDQLDWVVKRIKEDPSCRRTLWTLWNPCDVAKMKLPPCHMLSQIFVDDERRLTLLMYQRSCDFPVGVPANIQFYSALAKMIADQTDTIPHEFVHVTGDSHIYENQLELVEDYLKLPINESPSLQIEKAKDIFSYTLDDFHLTRMPKDAPHLKFPVAV
jgi:thymidylate synthase